MSTMTPAPALDVSRYGAFGPFANPAMLPNLLPIIPPKAAIRMRLKRDGAALDPAAAEEERSRVAGLMANRGKIPGYCYTLPSDREPHGVWGGLRQFTKRVTTETDLAEWAPTGAGVGLLARNFPAVDIDVTDAGAAERVRTFTVEKLGAGPARYGNAPKLLLMYRTEVSMAKRRISLRLPSSDDSHAVEFLADGQQYVVAGQHPKTGKPYRFADGHVPDPNQLVVINQAMVDAYWSALASFVTDELGGEIIVGKVGRSQPRDAAERQLMAPVIALAADEPRLREAMAGVVADDLTIADRAGSEPRVGFMDDVRAALADNWNAVQLINGGSVHDSQLQFGGDCARAGLDESEAGALTRALLEKAKQLGFVDGERYRARMVDAPRTVGSGYREAYRRMAGSVVLLAAPGADFGLEVENFGEVA
jgi:hypothetical protein